MPHTTPTQAAAVLTESEIDAVIEHLNTTLMHPQDAEGWGRSEFARAVEAKVLQKLGAQEPIGWQLSMENGSDEFHFSLRTNFAADEHVSFGGKVRPVYAAPTPALLDASVGEPSVPANVIEAVSAYGDSRADADGKSAEKLGAVVRAMRADLATRASSSAQAVECATDAARYRWLRKQVWNEAPMCVIMRPKANARLGSDCPALGRLDDAIDAARAGGAA